ncbi:MAG: hypothetical protein HC854_17920 [Flavobacterium sp.]|nr:hypothetical protein [Flavobacterium sp.]
MRVRFGDLAYDIIKKQKNDSLTRRNYFKIANRYFPLYELEKYKKVTKEVLELGKESNDSTTVARALYYMGDYFFEKAKNDSAYWYYNNAEKIYLKLDEKENLANTILHKAYVLLYEKDFLGSETVTIKALDFSLEINDNMLIYQCYGNLGSSLLGLGNYQKALDYQNKALEQLEKLKENYLYRDFKAQTFNNLGLVYQNSNQHEKAIQNFQNGLKIENLLQNQPVLYASLLDNLAYSKFKLNNKDGFLELNKALSLSDSINNIAGIIRSKIHLTEYYISKSNMDMAQKLNNQAYILAKKSNYNKEILKTLDLFTQINESKGLEYAKKYIALSDSLYNVERATTNKLARIEYETDEIILEKDQLTSQKRLILGLSILVAFIGGLFFIIFYQRAKQKELLFNQEQQKSNEEIYQLMLDQQTKIDDVKNTEKNRIARELHDGIMNKLASTRLNLFVLTKRNDEETIQKCIGHINEIQNIEKEVRAIAHELSNDVFTEKSNFKTILNELLIQQNDLYTAYCEYEIDNEINWEQIDIEIKMNLYRILQEALNNCNKYANAQKINVTILKQENFVTLQITDDGIGFNENKVKKGIGLKNMFQRASIIKAELNVSSEIGKGTTVLLKIPVE